MIGDDGVDGAVREALDERGGILGGAQRRVHLQRGLVLGGDGVLGEEHVVRRHLTGHRQALGLGGGHQIEPALGGDVLDVQRAPGQAAERDVAGQPTMPRRVEATPSFTWPSATSESSWQWAMMTVSNWLA